MKTKLIITVVLLSLVIVFMVQNAAVVQIKFLIWEADIPRSLLIIVTLLIGALIGWIVRTMYRRHRSR